VILLLIVLSIIDSSHGVKVFLYLFQNNYCNPPDPLRCKVWSYAQSLTLSNPAESHSLSPTPRSARLDAVLLSPRFAGVLLRRAGLSTQYPFRSTHPNMRNPAEIFSYLPSLCGGIKGGSSPPSRVVVLHSVRSCDFTTDGSRNPEKSAPIKKPEPFLGLGFSLR
jgi:hypothetical protein